MIITTGVCNSCLKEHPEWNESIDKEAVKVIPSTDYLFWINLHELKGNYKTIVLKIDDKISICHRHLEEILKEMKLKSTPQEKQS